MQAQVTLVRDYLPVPSRGLEFWDREKIEEIRYAALKAVEKRALSPPMRRGRILDRLAIRDVRVDEVNDLARKLGPEGIDRLDVDVGLEFGSVRLRVPIYLGDMSFGALAGYPNIALAAAADIAGAVVGVGEGGLHPEVAKHRNIVVQWASGRFGVDIDMLRKGVAVNIKIGQGAKPGIGGHLPGTKVVGIIAKLRKLPEGVEALSPAPHHDIYSIEDLAQRVRMLMEATGKPVLVKVAATHQVGYVAVGVARSNAMGVIIDGAGAGTGATPQIVRDHVGIPIDYAVPVADRLLRDNSVRDGFLVIGGGMISSGQDVFKLVLLGANMAMMSTAVLVAMGCIMCHQCNRGVCPAALTSKVTAPRRIDVDVAVKRVVNFLKAIERTLKLLTYVLGEDKLQKLVGRRELLEAYSIDERVANVVGVDVAEYGPIAWYGDPPSNTPVTPEVYVQGKTPVVGMGGIVPGYTTPAERPLDLLRIEAAQVTRPPVDPYREEVSLRIKLHDGTVYESPIVAPCYDKALEDAAEALGYARECELLERPDAIAVPPGTKPSENHVFLVIVDEGLRGARRRPWLEEWIVILDEEYWRSGIRDEVTLVAAGDLRNGADVYKLVALGADLVVVRRPFKYLSQKLRDKPYAERFEAYLNTLIELTWELKLLMGAGGVTSVESLNGNRWLLRSLDGHVAQSLGVKVAGE